MRNGQRLSIPSLAVDADFIALITAKMTLDILIEKNHEKFNEVPNIRFWGNKKEWIFNQGYQCINIKSENLKSLEDCIVCHGDEVIEKELEKSTEQVEEKYEKILSEIKKDNS